MSRGQTSGRLLSTRFASTQSPSSLAGQRDLRTILMALRINNDLERMGDHAVNIAEDALFLVERPQVKPLTDIPRMAEEATHMVRDSLLSFFQEDAPLAKSVCVTDSIVDACEKQSPERAYYLHVRRSDHRQVGLAPPRHSTQP